MNYEWQNDAVQAVVFEQDGQRYTVRGDLFVLGANAIQSPYIMLRSGMDGPWVGKGLHEQAGFEVEAYIDGIDNFDGSTVTTGINFSLYDGDFRRDAASALVYFENRFVHGLRSEPGKWRQTVPLTIVVEDMPAETNYVGLPELGDLPRVVHPDISDYAKRGIERALAKLPEVLAPLPVEAIHFRRWRATESHVQGTLRMGNDPGSSVVDRDLLHHRWRNLAVVGTAVFPTCACANPSLTASALSLRAARNIL